MHDVVAHLARACADALAGRLEGVTTAAWADAQVDQRRGHTIAELLEEWSTVAPRLEASADERMARQLRTIWVLDATAHEHDIRGALDRPGARDTWAWTSSYGKGCTASWLGPALRSDPLPGGL